MQGWFKLHREIFDMDLWNDVTTFRLFVYLIGMASHQDGVKTKGLELKRGQYVRSYRKLADDLSYKEGRGFKKYSLSTIKKCVNKLIESDRVNVKETEAGTLFTIVNYAKYQDFSGTEKTSANGSNEELRTNSELSANELRTNSEQEQELKNLRIKELKESTTTEDAIVFYQNNIGMIRPQISEELLDWINDLGDVMVIEAIKRSLERNKPSWGYTKSILKSWHNKGIKTPEQAQAEEVEFKNQQQSKIKPFYPKQQSGEVVPDWFKNRDNKSSNQSNQQEVSEELTDEQQRIAELLKKHSN